MHPTPKCRVSMLGLGLHEGDGAIAVSPTSWRLCMTGIKPNTRRTKGYQKLRRTHYENKYLTTYILRPVEQLRIRRVGYPRSR
jgi:hypothetical protein